MPRRPAWHYLFILIPWVFGFGMEVRNAAHAFAVAGREASVEGRFVGGPSHDHGQYDYRFTVAGRTYQGIDNHVDAPPTAGQAVTVWYDRTDPATNGTVDFEALGHEDRGYAWVMGLAILVVGSLILGVVTLRRAIRRGGEPEDQIVGD